MCHLFYLVVVFFLLLSFIISQSRSFSLKSHVIIIFFLLFVCRNLWYSIQIVACSKMSYVNCLLLQRHSQKKPWSHVVISTDCSCSNMQNTHTYSITAKCMKCFYIASVKTLLVCSLSLSFHMDNVPAIW